MPILEQFLAYASDFEKTLLDDDWSRLQPYFAADAVYEVQSETFGCRLEGPQAIFAGIKKSLDGFDRRFDGRDIEVKNGPEVSTDEIRMGWQVTYRKAGLSPFVLRGRSCVRYRGDLIVHLQDGYDPSVSGEAAAWQRENRMSFNPSYV